MYSYFKGKLVEKNPTDVVIDCNGIGYHLNITLQTFSQIKDREDVKLYAHLIVREDVQMLYGFFEKGERSMFRFLISVSGIGANTARMILSSMNSQEVFNAILSNNVPAFQAVKGVGAKTAQRIILDLKDKVVKEGGSAEIIDGSYNSYVDEALSALIMLGFARNTANKALQKVIKVNGSTLSVENMVRLTLKQL